MTVLFETWLMLLTLLLVTLLVVFVSLWLLNLILDVWRRMR